MDGKLEVGGLAMIVGARHFHENVGKVVRLLRRFPPFEMGVCPDGATFAADAFPSWVIEGSNLWREGDEKWEKETARYTCVDEHHLMPLSGDPDAQVMTSEHALEV